MNRPPVVRLLMACGLLLAAVLSAPRRGAAEADSSVSTDPARPIRWYIPPEEGPLVGNQNGWFVTHEDILPGHFTFSGKVRDVRDDGFRITPNCVWGHYTYRVTCLEPAVGKTGDFRARKVMGTRDLHLADLGALDDTTTVLVQGEVSEVFEDRKGFLAKVTLKGGPLPCRFDLVKIEDREPKPDVRSRHYGPHWQHTFDVYYPKEQGPGPFPVLMYIHGGGWGALDKAGVSRGASRWTRDGIAVVSVNYRFVSNAHEYPAMSPPVAAPLRDAARALQFVRYHAEELRIDPERIALTGGSAGGASSCWLAMRDDLAAPDSPDPVARMSTRVTCAAPLQAQTSLDPRQMRAWIPQVTYGAHAFFTRDQLPRGRDKARDFAHFVDKREEILPWIKEYSPYEWASADDPPMMLDYGGQKNTLPAVEKGHATHHPRFGEMLARRLEELGVECYFRADDVPCDEPRYRGWEGSGRFVRDHLLGREEKAPDVADRADQ